MTIQTTVLKYTLNIGKVTHLVVPEHSELLSTIMQRNRVCVYLLVPGSVTLTEKKFFVALTGSPFKENIKKFIGTCTTLDSSFVCHVFEVE